MDEKSLDLWRPSMFNFDVLDWFGKMPKAKWIGDVHQQWNGLVMCCKAWFDNVANESC
jgi:hypothetical protein